MRSLSRAILSVSILLFFVSFGESQIIIGTGQPGRLSAAQITALVNSTRKLDVSLQLDRSIYFPGEDISFSIAISNRTGQVLEVLEPMHIRTGGINLYQKDVLYLKETGTMWKPLAPHPTGPSEIGSNVPTRWINPAENVASSFRASDGDAAKHSLLYLYAAPEREGDYQLQYGYGHGASATFSIVYPKLEAWAEAVMAKPYEYHEVDIHRKPTGKISSMRRIVRVVALEYQGSHYVAVSLEPVANVAHPRLVVGGLFTAGINRQIGIYKRVATSTQAITSLKASSDASEHITITYTEQNGQPIIIRLN